MNLLKSMGELVPWMDYKRKLNTGRQSPHRNVRLATGPPPKGGKGFAVRKTSLRIQALAHGLSQLRRRIGLLEELNFTQGGITPHHVRAVTACENNLQVRFAGAQSFG